MGYQGSVLVVDDEIGPRESLRMILYPLYKVYTAADGEEALAFLQNQEIDIVTLDMKMPGPSGLEVLKEIRKMNADVGVVMISGYMTSQNEEDARLSGALRVIPKPFNVTDVMACVGRLLEEKKHLRKIKSILQEAQNLGIPVGEEIDLAMFH